MCLAIPMRFVKRGDGETGIVESGGVQSVVNLRLLEPEAVSPGDYLIIHAGFAIQKLNREEAEKTLRLFEEMSHAVR